METMPRAFGILVAVLTLALGVAPASAQLVAPANTVPPTITGAAVDMQTLTSSRGTWTGSATITYTRRWLRCADTTLESCSPIPGATGSTYELMTDDIGSAIRVQVTATNNAGSASATSAATAAVTAMPPSNVEPPSLSGYPADGELLVSGTGLWMGSPEITFTREWLRCDAVGEGCTQIADAAGSTLRLSHTEAGSTVRVRVTATNAGGSVSALSNPSGIVIGYPPSNLSAPTITGIAQEGFAVAGWAGEWTGGPSFSYRWLRCADLDFATCAEIPDATGIDYGIVAADVGSHLRFQVTATNPSGTGGMASAATDAVVAAPVDPEPEPEPDGKATGLANAAGHAQGAPALLSVVTGGDCEQRCLVSLLVGFMTGNDRGKRG